jgi:vacuolar-type H+-ATPase subunit I/STV1
VSAVHSQTKQFFSFYNVLEDQKTLLNKEINLLNSMNDNFTQVMSSPGSRDQFVQQLEKILEGINANLNLLEGKKQNEKLKCDEINDKYNELIEMKRTYFQSLKDFQEECKKNETLINTKK